MGVVDISIVVADVVSGEAESLPMLEDVDIFSGHDADVFSAARKTATLDDVVDGARSGEAERLEEVVLRGLLGETESLEDLVLMLATEDALGGGPYPVPGFAVEITAIGFAGCKVCLVGGLVCGGRTSRFEPVRVTLIGGILPGYRIATWGGIVYDTGTDLAIVGLCV
mmetsp:Transcript_157813/g.294339  ORF Transcript_157813/g.294339 Transcript_157813/m.294339 type:complete len:168 (+) Transcript_157813:224-727(+)